MTDVIAIGSMVKGMRSAHCNAEDMITDAISGDDLKTMAVAPEAAYGHFGILVNGAGLFTHLKLRLCRGNR